MKKGNLDLICGPLNLCSRRWAEDGCATSGNNPVDQTPYWVSPKAWPRCPPIFHRFNRHLLFYRVVSVTRPFLPNNNRKTLNMLFKLILSFAIMGGAQEKLFTQCCSDAPIPGTQPRRVRAFRVN